MNMARLLLMALLAILSSVCGAVGGAETAGNLIIEWTNRFELTSKQQELLHLYTGLEDASLSTEKARTMERQAQQISAALGSMSVRHAKPGELIVSVDKSSVPVITNPSDAN